MKKEIPTAENDAVGLNRRSLLKMAGAAAGSALITSGVAPSVLAKTHEDNWNEGEVAHIIPGANHDRFLIKTSFKTKRNKAPQINIDGRNIIGHQTDPVGRFWQFDITNLKPDTNYILQLSEIGGSALCDPWPLKTFPAPGTMPKSLRIFAYTCAGGDDNMDPIPGKTSYLDMPTRRKLLAKGMSFDPDVVIANGDHIYWDLETFLNKSFAKDYLINEFWPKYGNPIDYSRPMLDPVNAETFLNICDYQIAGLYQTTLRSTPSYFITDDHDYFENDEYDNTLATMPPDDYGLKAAIQTQQLYYPEFLPDANRPDFLQGGNIAGHPPGVNTVFGTMRYGDLMEAVLYDCRRFANYKGNSATLVPQWTEQWLIDRTKAEDTRHFMHCPSLPFVYSSGKLGDWYPDYLDAKANKLVTHIAKPGWQAGWFGQHQRIIEAISSQKQRVPLVVQGDFHASAASSVHRSGELDLSANPVNVVLSGTLGTGDLPFPSSYRSIESKPSAMIGATEALKATEKNGFTIIDVTPEKMTLSLYTWRPPQSPDEIDTMKPTTVLEFPRT